MAYSYFLSLLPICNFLLELYSYPERLGLMYVQYALLITRKWDVCTSSAAENLARSEGDSDSARPARRSTEAYFLPIFMDAECSQSNGQRTSTPHTLYTVKKIQLFQCFFVLKSLTYQGKSDVNLF